MTSPSDSRIGSVFIFVIPTSGTLLAGTKAPGLFLSRDRGESWSKIARPPRPARRAVLRGVLRDATCTDPLDPPGVYFGTNAG